LLVSLLDQPGRLRGGRRRSYYSERNIKVTYPGDLAIAEVLIRIYVVLIRRMPSGQHYCKRGSAVADLA
jgi:hypothetical protein